MIFDPAAHIVVGNMGWVDKGALWTFDTQNQTEGRVPIAGARFLSLRAGANGMFRLVHHHSPDQAVSIRRLSEPDVELASIRFDRGRTRFLGQAELWRSVDPAVVMKTDSQTRLMLIDALRMRVVDLDLSWFTNANYDLGYQDLVDCITIPAADRVIVSVQRSSELVVIDLESNERIGSIPLADRGGNPNLHWRSDNEFVASDYDTLCRVDSGSSSVSKAVRLQGAADPSTQQFIGDCDIGSVTGVVARPFSGDVLLVDSENFDVLGRAAIDGQPLAVCRVSQSRVVTRDWKTGSVAMGEF
jgi:hypothetical protein